MLEPLGIACKVRPSAPPVMSDAYLSQSISQQQTLAPHMRKSLEILQAGTQELSQMIRQSLETNPVLEDISDFESLDTETADDSLEGLNETDDDWRERSITENRGSQWTQDDEERRQRMFETLVAPVTLQSHLQKQIDESTVDADVREAAEVVLGSLDARGFLDQPAEAIARQSGCDLGAVRRGIELVRSFDPAGVGFIDHDGLAGSFRIHIGVSAPRHAPRRSEQKQTTDHGKNAHHGASVPNALCAANAVGKPLEGPSWVMQEAVEGAGCTERPR